jgi:hypothetical protein
MSLCLDEGAKYYCPDYESKENTNPEYQQRLHHRFGANEARGRGAHVPPNSCHNPADTIAALREFM